MSFVNQVLARYPAIDPKLRTRLLAALTDAERAQATAAPAKPKAPKKEKVVLQIEDDFSSEADTDVVGEEGIEDTLGITAARSEGVDPGDLNMDDYDE